MQLGSLLSSARPQIRESWIHSPLIIRLRHIHQRRCLSVVSAVPCPTGQPEVDDPTLVQKTRRSYSRHSESLAAASGLLAATVGVAANFVYWESSQPVGSRSFGSFTKSEVHCEENPSRVVDAGSADAWTEGERREFDISAMTGVKNDAVLVHKVKGVYYCTSAKCSHFGVPLKFGFNNRDSLVATCPAHDASFSLKTGDAVRGPVLKGIKTYPVDVNPRTGKVEIRIYPKEAEKKKPARRNPNNKETIAILGSGAAGYSCAENLRLEGFDGEIIMITRETGPPTDRTRISKAIGKAGELRSGDYMTKDLGVTMYDAMEVTKVDTVRKVLTYSATGRDKKAGSSELKYDKLLLSPGATPRQLFVPGAKLQNVVTIRSQKDNDLLKSALTDPNGREIQGLKAVVVGGGFIGLEMATLLKSKGCSVVMMDMVDLPLERVLGRKVGAVIAKWLHKNKVTFLGGSTVTYLRGERTVSGVETDSGDVLPADIVVVCAGVQMDSPEIEPTSSLTKSKDGSFLTDPFLKIRSISGAADVFAAGDCCSFPDFRTGRDLRIEHWNTAMEQGSIVAKNMLGKYKPYSTIPYFWTEIFGKKFKMVGSVDTFQHSVVEGDCDEMKFVVWYVNVKDEVTGLLTVENPKVACAAAELLRLGKMPKASEVIVGACNSDDLVRRLETLQRGEELKPSVFDRKK